MHCIPSLILTSPSTSVPCSRIDTSLPNTILSEKFPKFVEARSRGAEFTVTLQAGEMLYLPAGWFHEVKSTGSPPQGHMAMNYWFHPPDNDKFDAPYCSNFWEMDWDQRVKSVSSTAAQSKDK